MKRVLSHSKHAVRRRNVYRIRRYLTKPKFLAGDLKQPLTTMSGRTRRQFHKDLNDFLRQRMDAAGPHGRLVELMMETNTQPTRSRCKPAFVWGPVY